MDISSLLVRSTALVRKNRFITNPPPNRNTLEKEAMMKEGEFVLGFVGARTEFLRTELFAGITRTNIAQSTPDESKKQRNRREARKAYDTILRFLPQMFLS